MIVVLLTPAIRDQLIRNNRQRDADHVPVLKVFSPVGAATWLFTELERDGDTLFGLADLGFGSPELGYASLRELQSIRGRYGLPLERDLHFHTDKPLSAWTAAARAAQRIVEPD